MRFGFENFQSHWDCSRSIFLKTKAEETLSHDLEVNHIAPTELSDKYII